MHTWLSRGLQTAALAGGMFALGAGIASAETGSSGTSGTLNDRNGGAVSISAPVDVSGQFSRLAG